VSCPKGASCNPPPPMQVDCPPDMRDAGDPPAVTRRPPGKEDWLRVTPRLWSTTTGTTCNYQPEYFCAPPGKPYECTPHPKTVTVGCTMGDAGTRQVDSFVYKDGLGACRKVPASECKPSPRG